MNNFETTPGDASKIDHTLVHMGQAWRVIGVGVERAGSTYCHLASLENFRQQKNGRAPVQIADWVDSAVLANARSPE